MVNIAIIGTLVFIKCLCDMTTMDIVEDANN